MCICTCIARDRYVMCVYRRSTTHPHPRIKPNTPNTPNTPNKKKVRVLHDVDCVQVNYPEDNSGQVELTFHETDDDEGTTAFTQRFDWVVGADGVKSAVRGACEARTGSKKVRAVKLPERNEFVYKTLPLDLRPRCVVALRCVALSVLLFGGVGVVDLYEWSLCG